MSNDRSEPAKTAVAGQLERGVRPRAWIGPSGQTMPDEIYVAWATSYPADAKHFAPLYDQAALDAAVAAERERCAKLVEGAQRQWPDDGLDGWLLAAEIRGA